MIERNEYGRSLMSLTMKAVIRRIPLEKHGTSRNGNEWTLGSLVVEAFEDGNENSAMLYLSTFDTELIEVVNRLGVGKKVEVKFHIECREIYECFRTNLVLDSINGLNESEDFVYGTAKK